MLCRRGFIASCAAAFALAPWAAHAKEDRLAVETRIGGKGPFRFVVDTGADRTVLADDVASALGLVRGAPVSVQRIARTVDAPTVRLENLEFGYERSEALDAPVLPRAWLDADGYLGLDAIEGRRVAFDFCRKMLSVTAPRHPQLIGMPSYHATVVKAAGPSGRLRSLDCHVDGVHAAAFVDSGAEVSVGNPALFIGMDLLRQFARVTVDYGQKEYRFEFAANRSAQLALAGGV